MAGHTPGPWVSDDSYHSGSINRLEYPTRHIAMVSQFSKVAGDRLENEANARLITAAPDLLEALQNLMAAYSEPDDRICCNGALCGCQGATKRDMAEHYAKEAIAKATGVTD